MGWLVDRLLVAGGRRTTPLINLNGSVEHIHRQVLREQIASVLPTDAAAATASHMLLLHRGQAGKILLEQDLEHDWRAAGVRVHPVHLPSVDHLDARRPATIAAMRDALAFFVETGSIEPAPPPCKFDLPGFGAVLFRLLESATPPDGARLRDLLKELPSGWIDPQFRASLLFLALSCGDTEITLGVATRLATEDPAYRNAMYAQIAVVNALGRRDAAVALAEEWICDHPNDTAMRARANMAPQPKQPWNTVFNLNVDTTQALDIAATSCATGK